MTLQLSGESETPDPGRGTYRVLTGESLYDMLGSLVSGKDKKGHTIDVPRDPISVAHVLERRMTAPEDVRKAWQTHFFLQAMAPWQERKEII